MLTAPEDPHDHPARSSAHPWRGDRPPHLPCARGDLPPCVFFPGDPGRVDRFADLLEDFTVLGQNREFRVARGIFQGFPVGICSTGIGGPSTEIALVEAAELGCTVALRVGGTGALDPSIALGSILLVDEALRGEGGAARFYAPLTQPALPDPAFQSVLAETLSHSGIPYRRVTIASADGYYAAQARPYPGLPMSNPVTLQSYRDRGGQALDMESETILTIGKILGLRAAVLLAVHANRANDTWLEDYEAAQDRLLKIACQAMLAISRHPPLQR